MSVPGHHRVCLALSGWSRQLATHLSPSSLATLSHQQSLARCICTSKRVDSAEATPRGRQPNKKYKLVVVGGGSGGAAIAAKFSSLGKECAVIEPADMHYYQPIWTLVGAGLKDFASSGRPMCQVLPPTVDWVKDKAASFDPQNNSLKLQSGDSIEYDYLVMAMGMQLDFDKVEGLQAALENDPMVASNYHHRWVNKTFPALQRFHRGNAIFTFPNTPIKCPGAPQKIMYLAEEIIAKAGKRNDSKIIFNTSLPVIFGVKKYADALQKVVKRKELKVNYRHNLVSVDHHKKEAVFAELDNDNNLVPFKYEFLHVTPPMSSPDPLKKSLLANEAGYVDVDKHTLQHTKFSNVFALGDNSSLPTSKTAAAIASQCGILEKNLHAVMDGKQPVPLYDGYTSCPLITSSSQCILAEFDYQPAPLETLPVNQAVERSIHYQLKANVIPALYWGAMTKGRWNGPRMIRKALHLGMSKEPKVPAQK